MTNWIKIADRIPTEEEQRNNIIAYWFRYERLEEPTNDVGFVKVINMATFNLFYKEESAAAYWKILDKPEGAE